MMGISQKCACLGHGPILPLLNIPVQEPARCAVSLRGPFCASPSEKQNIKDRNKINTESLETGERKNSFSGHAGGLCQVLRKRKQAADKNRFDLRTQLEQQERNCLTRILETPCMCNGCP